MIYGVDLGTSRSTIGYFKKRGIEIVADNTSKKAIPSVAFLSKKNEWIFGSIALKYAVRNPERLIYDTKRMLGHKFNDPEITQIRQNWPFITKEEKETHNILISIKIDGEVVEYYPYQISGLILKNLVDLANQRSAVTANKIVVTIPATFSNLQREDLNRAANYVGLQIVRFINEPIAATIAYEFMNYDVNRTDKKKILVFDLGAGTLDISFIEADKGNFKILANDGDPYLGGRDWDIYLYKYVFQELKNKYPDKEFTKKIAEKIRQKCEEAKIGLSSSDSYDILIEGNNEDDDIEYTLTRDDFYKITQNLFKRCIIPIEKVLKSSDFKRNTVDDLIMVGGSTNMPKIREILLNYMNYNIEPFQGVDPDEAVAYGACIVGAKTSLADMMSNQSQSQDHNEFFDNNNLSFFENMNLLGVNNISFGIKLKNNNFDILIPKKFQIPCQVIKEYTKGAIYIESGYIPLFENVDNNNQKIVDILIIPDEEQILPNERIKIISEMTLDGNLSIKIQSSKGESDAKFEPNSQNEQDTLYHIVSSTVSTINAPSKSNNQNSNQHLNKTNKNQQPTSSNDQTNKNQQQKPTDSNNNTNQQSPNTRSNQNPNANITSNANNNHSQEPSNQKAQQNTQISKNKNEEKKESKSKKRKCLLI